MDGGAGAVCNAAKYGHSAGWEQAKKSMPALDINELIQLVTSVFTAKENQKEAAIKAAMKLAKKYKKPVEAYVNAFSVAFIEQGLKQVKYQKVSELGNQKYAKKIVKTVKNIEKAVAEFINADIDEIELITRISRTGILEVGQEFIIACGINLNEVKDQIQTALGDVNGASILMISFTATAAAFKIMREALQDAAVMHEERLRIEAECSQSIAMMRQYREQMNAAVSNYLFIHAETFNDGLAAMDQAIIDGDVNGFIRGNVMIQEILNYDVQFRNQDEFDALMDSDIAFKL